MGFVSIDSPFAALIHPNPEVLTYARLQDTMWRFNVSDCGAMELRDGVQVLLQWVADDLRRCRFSYSYWAARWDFSPDVDPDRATVRFMLEGQLYEVRPPEPGETGRKQRRVPSLPPAAGGVA